MLLKLDTLISAHEIQIEIDGNSNTNLTELNTVTGEAKAYARDAEGHIIVKDGTAVIESIMLPVDKLHVYLVKPK